MDKQPLLENLSEHIFLQLCTNGYALSNLSEETFFYKGILNEIPSLVHIRDQQTGKIIWWNAEWTRLLHPTNKGTASDIEVFMERSVHPDDKILLKESNEHYQEKNAANFGGVIRVRFPGNKDWSWLIGISRVVRQDAEGIPLNTLAVFLDITHATRTKSQIQLALREILQRDNQNILNKITKREKQIIQLLIDGCNNNKIAKLLFISRHTVETHRKNIRMKLHVKNTSELIALAKDIGI